jgi:hypothetical protein
LAAQAPAVATGAFGAAPEDGLGEGVAGVPPAVLDEESPFGVDPESLPEPAAAVDAPAEAVEDALPALESVL